MNKEKQKCPYCSRKISYTTRLIEHGKGEHTCPHCQKISKISQNFNIWMSLVFCLIVAAFIMVFYFASADKIETAYIENGTGKVLMTLFFGDTKEIKWILWELLPFVVFFFISPLFIEFVPLKRFMEQTSSSIDLSVPTRTATDKGKQKGSPKVIPKAQPTEYSGEYEDISSSSGTATDKTRSFTLSEPAPVRVSTDEDGYTDVTPRNQSRSESYSSDAPLRRMNRETPSQEDSEDVREYVPRSSRPSTQERPKKQDTPPANGKKPSGGNYSGNRKF